MSDACRCKPGLRCRACEERNTRVCPNCDHSVKEGGHFVPPSLGDAGFFACDAFCKVCRDTKERDEL